ncbi:NADPH oxidase 5 [Holothuria leucospilota]|uniref:NADPH oxidase 5 n=1 Tax=Holothuria leucospilota TaxID=206669 RepID=A0A9Q1C8V6_HOLLE|nr:NADPH oxidase 5 [Holothuria leucospilota]
MDEDAKWLSRFEKRFHHFSGEDNLIQLDEFIKVLEVKESFFAERFFEFIDEDKSGSICFKELLTALRLLVNGGPTDKLHLLFKVYDVDGNGSIDFEELRTVLRFCMAESALSLSEETLIELTEVLFEDADTDGNGKITFEELRSQLDRYPDIASNLTISAAEWLKPPRRPTSSSKLSSYCAKIFKKKLSPLQQLSNNLATVFLLVTFVFINIGCFIWGFFNVYRSTPTKRWLMLARINGRALNFNCVFILVLMLRKTLTWLRSTRLGSILPIDQHVSLHKFVGIVILVETFLHVVGHLGNCVETVSQNTTDITAWQFLFTTASGIGWVGHLAFPTGWGILVILVIICIFSLSVVRRRGYFQVFYLTHQLSILFWVLLILHAQYFWTLFLLPGSVYALERILRLRFIRRVRNGRTFIKAAVNLPANVTHLIITRPPKFEFQAGDYVFICIPSIARHEWHPFTISSAPEQKGFITLHVRAQGNWTKRLYNYVKNINSEDASHLENQDGKLNALAEEGSNTTIDASDLEARSAASLLKSNIDNPNLGTPTTLRNIAVFDDSTPVRSAIGPDPFSMQQSFRDNKNDKRVDGYESAQLWMKNEYVTDDRKALLSRASTLSSSSNSNNGGVSAKSRGTLPEIRGTPPVAVRHDALKKKSPKRKENKIQPFDPDESPTFSRVNEKVQTISESMANNNNSVSAPAEQKDEKRSPSRQGQVPQPLYNKRLANAVSVTMRNGKLLRPKRKSLNQRKTQHSLDLANTVGLDENSHTGIEAIIDGPYGAPAQHIYEAEHAVLIGGGIGVTPFASILQSIHHRYKEYKLFDPMCWSSSHIPDSDDKAFHLRKVDFIWINRDQKSFEWFISLLNLIEIEQEEIDPSQRFITMHLYMTSALSRNDVKAIGLYVALDLIHQKQRRDMITGLMTRTQAGRPDWDKVFTKIAAANRGKVTVFFCGSPQLGKVVQQKCHQYGFSFRKENF